MGRDARRIVVDPLSSIAAARDVWIAAAQQSDNLFSTWEWADIWWKHFGAGRHLRLAHVHDGAGHTVALLPLYAEQRAGIRLTRFLGHGVADQLGPVCALADTRAAAEALNAAGADGDVLVAERLAAGRAWEHELRGRLLYEVPSPVIALAEEGGWDDYLSRRSANFRHQVRRRSRRLPQQINLRYRLADDPARLSADFDTLLRLHAARWGSTSSAFTGARKAFHRDFAACALQRGWLRLWLAECDGRAVAAWYGFRFADVEYYYQAGRLPAFDRFAVGAGILEHSIREAFGDGVREYRMLLGDEQYKSRYATSVESVKTVVTPHSPLGRAVVAVTPTVARFTPGRRLLNSDSLRHAGVWRAGRS